MNLRLIAYTLIAILIALIFANKEMIRDWWAVATDKKKSMVVLIALIYATILAAWILQPFAKFLI